MVMPSTAYAMPEYRQAAIITDELAPNPRSFNR
jgi:hypothetical protein